MNTYPFDHKTLSADGILIVGAGMAGLYTALKLAPRPVCILASKRSSQGAASAWAQGGIAAALKVPPDSIEAHIQDTIKAGAGLVDEAMAHILASEGADCVHELAALGIEFDRAPDGQYALSLEAAHSHARIARVAGDSAGAAIMKVLIRRAKSAPHITLITGWRAESLLSDGFGNIAGILARRNNDGAMLAVHANNTLLATGGIGGLYECTTNPPTARGDALGMAALCQAKMRDMEFIQFHPTAINIGRTPAPLATEALRGAGAQLVNARGERFMPRYHKQAELAPRDDVARAVFTELQAGNKPALDCRTAIGVHFPEFFPTVFASCMHARIDPRITPIPVMPALHYHMGGIATDSYARTSLPGLYAIGECAATGVHGANRLASNSLLEAVVFGRRASQHILNHDTNIYHAENACSQPWFSIESKTRQQLRHAMAEHCGLYRDGKSLEQLLALIAQTIEQVGHANPLVASHMIVTGALARQESRGAHYRSDYPDKEPQTRSSLLTFSMLK